MNLSPSSAQLQQMANKLRAHSVRMTTAAGSGHPSTCCSMAEIMSVLFFDQMRFDPKTPRAHHTDHCVLSKGHAAPILWAALSEAGAIHDDLLTLRHIDSALEGHPTPRVPWVRVATGSLGQGLSVACGMATGLRLEQLDGQIFTILGDGEIAEGSVWEAVQFAGHYKLQHLCAIIDLNALGQSGPSYFGNDAAGLVARFAAFGWHAIAVDGHNVDALRQALQSARNEQQRPTAVIAATVKGKGISFIEGKSGWHGKVLSKEQLAAALRELGDCDIALPVTARTVGTPTFLPNDQPTNQLADCVYERGQLVATREAYGAALVRLSNSYPALIALDADTKNSTFSERLLKEKPDRFVECFIAEQNMVGVAMGLSSMGWIACVSSFACFLSRAYDFLRMAVVSQLPHLIVCGSHCGVSIGEDGPSQMALEDLAMMRGLVQSTVVYPADAVSTERLLEALVAQPGVSYLRTSRPKTPVLYDGQEKFPIGGSKVLRSSARDRCTIVAAGVTVHEALKAADLLHASGVAVRVIDAYSIKPIDVATLRRAAQETQHLITVEDHSVAGGLGDAVCQAVAGLAPVTVIGVHEVPRSGTPEELLAMHGLDAASIVKRVKTIL